MKKSLLTSLITFAILSLLSFGANAQSKREIRSLERKAFKAYSERNYKAALEQFIHLDSIAADPGNYYDYMIGMSYLSTEDAAKALPHLIKAKHGNQTSFVVDYYLGRAYMIHQNYEAAERHFKMYLKSLAASNLKFVNKVEVTSENRVHMEKSMNDVVALISLCVHEQNNKANNVANR